MRVIAESGDVVQFCDRDHPEKGPCGSATVMSVFPPSEEFDDYVYTLRDSVGVFETGAAYVVVPPPSPGTGQPRHSVVFRARADCDGSRDGVAGWDILVDQRLVLEGSGHDMDIGANRLQPLWDAIGVTLEFDYD